jgi:hypothetical protein
MERKELGKIRVARFGFGGYQDAMIGITFDFGSEKDGWGVGDFSGFWSLPRSKDAKWSETDRLKSLGETVMFIAKLLEQAKVDDVDKLVGKPVECTFDGMTLKSWRLLTEVI